ncbi:MAG: ATP-binding protein [Thermoguttaceae bacterium]|nr:ATP-binding protein [Thermoguttaceae bacterium]
MFYDIVSLVIMVLAASIATAVAYRCGLRKCRVLYELLPGRIGVANRDMKVLFVKKDGEHDDIAVHMSLADCRCIDNKKVCGALTEVFDTGKTVTVEYEHGGKMRTLTAAPIPEWICGEEAVIWFSHDDSELQTALEKARQESRDAAITLQTLIDQLPIYLYAEDIDNNFKHVVVNKPCERLWNRTTENIIGKNDYELFGNNQEIDVFRQTDLDAMKSNEMVESMLPVTGADGQTRLHKFYRCRLELSGGRNWLLGMAVDVSKEQELLENQKVLNKCFEDILKMGMSQNVTNPVLKALCLRLKATRCYLFRHDVSRRIVVPAGEYCAGQEDLSINEIGELILNPDEPWYQEMSQGNVIGAVDMTLPESLAFCGSWAPVHKRYRVQSMYACRVTVSGEFWGNFGVAYIGQSHVMTEQERLFFKSAAHLLGLMLERRKEHEDLQNSIRELQTVNSLAEIGAELSQSAFFEIDHHNTIYHETGKFKELVPMIGRRWLDIKEWILPEDYEKCKKSLDVLAQGAKRQIDISFRSDCFQERRYYRLRITRTEDKDGPKYYGAIQNVTAITTQLRQLREESDIWSQVVNSISTLIFVKNMSRKGRFVVLNEAAANLFRLPQDEMIGKTVTELKLSFPTEAFCESDAKALLNPEGIVFDETIVDENGFSHRYTTSKKRHITSSGESLLFCTMNDITASYRQTRCEQAGNLALLETVNEQNLDKAISKISNAIMNNMQADRIVIVHCDGGENRQIERVWDSDNDLYEKDCASILQPIWDHYQQMWLEDKVVVFSDLRNGAFHEKLNGMPAYRAKSAILSPIWVNKQLWGIICISYVERYQQFSEIDEQISRLMANIISVAVVRQDMADAIRVSEFEKSIILNNIKIPLWLFDAEGTLLLANKEAGQFNAMNFGVMKTARDRIDFTKQLPVEEQQSVLEAKDTGQSTSREIAKDSRHYILGAEPVYDESGQIAYVVQSAIDTTYLRQLIEYQEMIATCLETFLREDTIKDALASVMKTICHYSNADGAFVLRFDQDKCIAEPYFSYWPDCKQTVLNSSVHFDKKELWYRILSKREMLVFSDTETAEARTTFDKGWQRDIQGMGIKSFFAAGLYLDDELWGNFGIVFEKQNHCITDFEKNYLEMVGRVLGILLIRDRAHSELVNALDNIRKNEAEKNIRLENEIILNRGMNAVLGEQEPIEAMNSVLRLVCDKLQAARVYVLRFNYQDQMIHLAYEYHQKGVMPFDSTLMPFNNSALEYLCKNEIAFVDDVNDEENIKKYGLWKERNEQLGIRSICLSKLRVHGEIWGNLGIAFEKDLHEFTTAERDFILSTINLIELMVQRTLYQEEIIAALKAAKDAAKAKSFFLASMSHEIRTPLNAVIGFTDILKDRSLDPKTREEYLDSIACSGNTLLQLINDMLDLSSLEAGKMQIVTEAADFEELGSENLHVFAYQAEQKGITLINQIDSMPILELDKLRIRQIMFNLLGNAVKFTRQGSVTLKAHYEPSGEKKGMLTFSVVDTGIGIDPEDQKKLMEPFVQLSKMRGTNSGNNGTGLGLTVCRRLVEKMGGGVTLSSKSGEGSTFTVSIPVASQNISLKSVRIPAVEPEFSSDVKNSKVLLVDDVIMNLKVLEAIFRKCGFQNVFSAVSGEEALNILESEKIDIVLTDMWMPSMNGAELREKIHRLPQFARLPVIAVTADVEAKSNFALDKFTAVLFKPVTKEKVQNLIAELVGKPREN